MLFVLSKLISFFLYPLTWLLALLTVAAYRYRRQKSLRLLPICLIFFYFFTCPAIIAKLGRLWDVTTPANGTARYSCGIVLGGYVAADRQGIAHFSSFSDRFIQSVKLFKTQKVSCLLLSGGSSNLGSDTLFKEADFVAAEMRSMGIPDSSLIKDPLARNTQENAVNSRRILAEKNIHPPYLLITSAFHMRRAVMLFERAGLPVTPYSCDFKVNYDRFRPSDLLPSSEALATWNIYLHEIVGYAYSRFVKA